MLSHKAVHNYTSFDLYFYSYMCPKYKELRGGCVVQLQVYGYVVHWPSSLRFLCGAGSLCTKLKTLGKLNIATEHKRWNTFV